VVDLLEVEEVGEVDLRLGPGPQQVPAHPKLHPVRQFAPLLRAVETAVDDVVHLLLRPHHSVQHQVRARHLDVAPYPVQHGLASLVEGVQLNSEAICVLSGLLALGNHLKSQLVFVHLQILVAATLIIYLLAKMKSEVFLHVS
jgi:hypothetical protein